MGFSANGRSLTIDGLTLMQIVRNAYGVFPAQVSTAPLISNLKWIDSQRYDITAKAEGDEPLGKAQSTTMLQQLLADRFALRLHRESKVMVVHALMRGKNGLKLTKGGAAGPYLSRPAPGTLIGQNASMASLVAALGGYLGRPVIDETGLKGGYDFSVEWAPDENAPDSARVDPSRPSVFTALQDQLGLKLESKKSAVEVLVIDSAEKPSPN